MSEEREENLTVEEIKERMRTGWTLDPRTPGLQQAQQIIYVCRVPRLMRVNYLETDDEGFRAVATPLHDLGCRILTIRRFEKKSKQFAHQRGIAGGERGQDVELGLTGAGKTKAPRSAFCSGPSGGSSSA